MLVRRSAEAPDGVARHMRAHGCGLRACEVCGSLLETREFGMVFIGNPRKRIKWGGANRIVLRSKTS